MQCLQHLELEASRSAWLCRGRDLADESRIKDAPNCDRLKKRFAGNENRDKKIHDKILLFPAHGTVRLTIDSSRWLYGAYRELAAAAVRMIQQEYGVLGVVGNPSPSAAQPALSREDMEDEAKVLTDALK